ncbi:MAG: glycoside hydrolase family 172 protein [Candidatus Bathyarchaeota archaeon]
MAFFSVEGLPDLKKGNSRMVSSYDRGHGNRDYFSVEPGEAITLADLAGSGVINRQWFTIRNRDPLLLRKAILRYSWDDEAHPSVETPFGDFFGCGFAEYRHHTAHLQGMTSGGFHSYWPMPYGDGAHLELVNLCDQPISHLYFNIQYQETDEVASTRFHAQWRRENPTRIDENYTILEAESAGHYVGCLMNMQSYVKGSLVFLEGDEMIYIDDESVPSIYGTGTEDYFQGAWYFTHGEFSAPFHGLTLFDRENAKVSAYRHHVPDPISFKESIRVTIEHCHGNILQEDYSSLAYWYQVEPHKSWKSLNDPRLLEPLPDVPGYLMTELHSDTPENVERRKVLHQAAQLRYKLRVHPDDPELRGLTEDMIMEADYAGLKHLVEKYM